METPLVSAIMVTGKSPDRYRLALAAVESFRRQDYVQRELVIVNDGDRSLLPEITPAPFDIREVLLNQKLSLGALRNAGLEAARGSYILQLDDDDFSGPNRISLQMAHAKPGHAVLLRKQVRYSFPKNTAMVWRWNYASVPGIPGTVLHPNLPGIHYRDEGKAEDDHFLKDHFKGRMVVVENEPQVYLRFFHGSNTWDEQHIMGLKSDVKNAWYLLPPAADYLRIVLLENYLPTIPAYESHRTTA